MIIMDIFMLIVGIAGSIACKALSSSYLGFSNKYDTYFWICLAIAAWGAIDTVRCYLKKKQHDDEANRRNYNRNPINMRVCSNCGMKNIADNCTVCPKCGKPLN